LNFYDEYFKKTNDEATEYKLKYLKSVVKNNTIYKFIQFDENYSLNNVKLNALKNEVLWFSYYKYLNDNTEFEINYDIIRVSRETNKSPEFIKYLFDIMVEVYDICSFTYEYHKYMWREYANYGNGICLIFYVNNLDVLFQIDYIEKNKIDFSSLIIKSLNNSFGSIDYNDPMALLPFVVKNPYNGILDSTKEKEVRILYSPFDKEECNQGKVAPNIKTNVGHKGINVNYSDVGLSLKGIILGNKCESNMEKEIVKYSADCHIPMQVLGNDFS